MLKNLVKEVVETYGRLLVMLTDAEDIWDVLKALAFMAGITVNLIWATMVVFGNIPKIFSGEPINYHIPMAIVWGLLVAAGVAIHIWQYKNDNYRY